MLLSLFPLVEGLSSQLYVEFEPVGSRLSGQPAKNYRKHQEGEAGWEQAQSGPGVGNLRIWVLRYVLFFCICTLDRKPINGCRLDHFLEDDTILHSWECLSEIILHPDCQDILLDVGMPVKHKVFAFNPLMIPYAFLGS